MRKTRLVILPTKCLHQMGFLLLFLSCPVIGDWGRIRPDNENLQKAIEADREGTCGLQRDTPGGFHDFTDGKGLNIRRFREDNDMSLPRMSRFNEERDSRRMTRNRLDEKSRERTVEFRRERDPLERSARSRRSELERNDRNDIRSRSLSLSRLEAIRKQTRRESDAERRDGERRLSLSRRTNERENERRAEREGERMQSEKARSFQRRENERLSLQRREDEMRRRNRNIRKDTERRLSLSRTEENLRKYQRSEDRESFGRRLPEIKKSRNDVGTEGEKIERDVTSRREIDNRQKSGQNIRDERQMKVLNRRAEILEKTRRVSSGVNSKIMYPEDKTEGFVTGAMKWLNLENYETPTIGDWSSNCVIGAVAYYLSTKQAKAF